MMSSLVQVSQTELLKRIEKRIKCKTQKRKRRRKIEKTYDAVSHEKLMHRPVYPDKQVCVRCKLQRHGCAPCRPAILRIARLLLLDGIC